MAKSTDTVKYSRILKRKYPFGMAITTCFDNARKEIEKFFPLPVMVQFEFNGLVIRVKSVDNKLDMNELTTPEKIITE
jgi:hypothetical protein